MGSCTPVTSPSKPARRMRRTGQCLMLVIGRSSLEPPHYHGAVGAAKAEGIRQGDIDLHFARFIGAVVQIALRILIEDINSGRRNLVVYRQGRKYGLDSASGDRKRVVKGKSVSVRVDIGGRRIIKQNINI